MKDLHPENPQRAMTAGNSRPADPSMQPEAPPAAREFRVHAIHRAVRAFAFSDPIQAANTILNYGERAGQLACLRSYPPTVQIETTTRCNLNCWICQRDRHPAQHGDLPPELIPPIVALSRRVRETVLFGYGEPLLSRTFYSLLERVKSARVSFTTNGQLFDSDTASRTLSASRRPVYSITFSIDAAEPETFAAIRRGASYEQVWENLALAVKAARENGRGWPQVWINFVAMKRNVHELPGLIVKAAAAGVSRVNVFHLVVWEPWYEKESLLYAPDLTRLYFAKAASAARRYRIHLDLPAEIPGRSPLQGPAAFPACYQPWSYAYIRNDGAVHACCYSESLLMGNLRENQFDEIWNGPSYQSLRKTVNRNPPECCRRCEMRFRYAPPRECRSVFLKFLPRGEGVGG